MSITLFKKKDNLKMLWDVISDVDVFRFLSPEIQSNIYDLFIKNIEGFYENEKNKNDNLVDLNKKYILLIVNYIKKTYPYQPNKIKIHDEPQMNELITYEEIHNDKKTRFENDLNKVQEDFENLMTIKPPPVPEFTDPNGKSEKPIKEMDKILKEMQMQRNYEVEEINRNYTNTNNTNNWLKPQETSLKNEKFENNFGENSQSRFKFLNEMDINSNQTTNKKSVSFSNNDKVEIIEPHTDNEDELNIFSKLKKVNSNKDVNEDRITQLEKNIIMLNNKIDKIISLLSNSN